jgi:hypothetical protein
MVLELFSTCGSILENNKDLFTNANAEGNAVNNKLAFGIFIFLIICTLPAVVISINCNPQSPVIMGIVAFFFDRIYLFQHVVRKYLMKEKNYCKNISCK